MLPLFFLAVQAAPAVPPAPPAPWELHRGGDATASTGTWASAAAMSADRNGRLTVRCDRVNEPTVSVQFATRQPLAAGDPRPVSISVDGGVPITATWAFPGRAAVTSDPATVTQLTVAIATAHTITATTTDAGHPVSFTFAGPANPDAVHQVVEACGYTFGTVPAPVAPATPPGSMPAPASSPTPGS